jgi:ribosomal protein L40E
MKVFIAGEEAPAQAASAQPMPGPSVEAPPARPAAAATPPPAAASAAPISPADDLPEFMKANRRIAQRACSRCGAQLELGDDVFNCRACGSSMHQACHTAVGGCANPSCPQTKVGGELSLVSAPPVESPPAAPMAADETPCRFCGERIKVGARKCRFCNEFQSEADRGKAQGRTPSDEKLNAWEILLGILCAGIGCIVGIVYIVQGKKKGWKLLLLSIIMWIIFYIIRAAAKR